MIDEPIRIRGFCRDDAPLLQGVLTATLQACPDADAKSEAYFLDEVAFESGRNIFCAVKDRRGEHAQVLGYSLLRRTPDVLHMEADLRVHPSLQSRADLQDALLQSLLRRAASVKHRLPIGLSPVVYCLANRPRSPRMDYLATKGFTKFRPLCVQQLERSLVDWVPAEHANQALRCSTWRLDSQQEVLDYVLLHNEAFPYSFMDLSVASVFAEAPNVSFVRVFHNDTPIGAAMLVLEGDIGTIEYLAVTPCYRGLGAGRALGEHCLTHLRSAQAVRARVATGFSNVVAKRLYHALGFRPFSETHAIAQSV